jgi:hypothetical protein
MKPQFTILDIRKILKKHYNQLFWTEKILDTKTMDSKDLTLEDFKTSSMHTFIFIDKEGCVCEKDIQISNSNFIIFEDSEFSQPEKVLTIQWLNQINTTIQL